MLVNSISPTAELPSHLLPNNPLASKLIPSTLVAGVKQLGEDKISRSPVRFEDAPRLRKPSWIRVRLPAGNSVDRLKAKLREKIGRAHV